MTKPLRGPALNRLVREYVKDYIITNQLRAGDPLPSEAELSDKLGVGRSSIREAVKSLESLGIVEIQRGNGTFVREYNLDPVLETFLYGIQLNAKSLLELLRIRLWLETAAMDDVIEHIGEDTFVDLDRILMEWETRAEKGDNHFADLDEQFHRTLYSVLDNQMMLHLSKVFWVLAQKMREERRIRTTARGFDVVNEHRAILDAVKANDIPAAKAALATSYRYAIQEFIRSL